MAQESLKRSLFIQMIHVCRFWPCKNYNNYLSTFQKLHITIDAWGRRKKAELTACKSGEIFPACWKWRQHTTIL